MQLTLTEAERDLLIEILRSRMGELREEIYHTTVSGYRDMLKAKEATLLGLLALLDAESAPTADDHTSGA